MPEPLLLPYRDTAPELDEASWVAPSGTLIGAVRLLRGSSVWFGAVLRAEAEPIVVGVESNVQDNCVFHTDRGFPLLLGEGVSVGHGAVLHGCTVQDGALVGMRATILNGARVGAGSLVAAGSLVLEGTEIPPKSLVAGVPGRVRRTLTDAEVERNRANAASYAGLCRDYREAGI